MPSNDVICKFHWEYSLNTFRFVFAKSWFGGRVLKLSPKETFYSMNSNPKVHVVDGNSGVHSSVTQQAGISLSRYWSGEASGTEKKAYVFKFFFVNIPPSETVSWMFFSTTHNIQRSVFRLTFRSQCQLSCRSYILQLIIVNPTNINYVWQILQLIIVHCASISRTWRSM